MFLADERAASLQIGAVLLFGFLIISLTVYQAVVVPQETRAAEFDAYQEASGQLVEIHDDVVDAGTTGAASVRAVETGAKYPPRVWTINPPAPAGTIRSTPAGNVTISNAVGVGDSDLAEYWDGSDREFQTNRLVFDPAYNRLNGTPIAVDGTLAYRQTGADAQQLTSQRFIVDDRFTLVTITGDMSVAGRTTAVTTEPLSVGGETIPVTAAGDADSDGEPELFVTIPTELSASQWENQLLANGNVENVTAVPGGVRVELNGTVTYRMRLAQVEMRERGDDSRPPAPDAHYIVRAAGHNTSITANQTADVTAEVRDRFNNPVTGAEVTFTDPEGGTTNVTTNEFGQATLSWTPTETGTDSITAAFGGGDVAREQTTFTVQVGAACPDDAPDCGDGEVDEKALDAQDQFLDNGQSTDVFLDSAEVFSGGGSSGVHLNFNNTGNETWTAFEVRLIAYHTSSEVKQVTGDYDGTTVEWGRLFTPLNSNYTVSSGTTHQSTLDNLDDNPDKEEDWLMFSVKYERDDGKQMVSTYIEQLR